MGARHVQCGRPTKPAQPRRSSTAPGRLCQQSCICPVLRVLVNVLGSLDGRAQFCTTRGTGASLRERQSPGARGQEARSDAPLFFLRSDDSSSFLPRSSPRLRARSTQPGVSGTPIAMMDLRRKRACSITMTRRRMSTSRRSSPRRMRSCLDEKNMMSMLVTTLIMVRNSST